LAAARRRIVPTTRISTEPAIQIQVSTIVPNASMKVRTEATVPPVPGANAAPAIQRSTSPPSAMTAQPPKHSSDQKKKPAQAKPVKIRPTMPDI
jgi:hypothetical protein